MSLVRKTLLDSEEIILETRSSIVPIIRNFIIGLVVMIYFHKSIDVIGAWIGMIIFVYLMLYALIKFITTQLAITDKRMVAKVGLINTEVLDLPLDKINSIYVKNGLFGKIFRYGTLCVSTSMGITNYPYIKDAFKVRSQIIEEIETYKERKIKKQAMEMAKTMGNMYF